MESGKNARFNDQFIELTDSKGYVLHWEIIPTDKSGKRIPGSELKMYDPAGKEIASVSMKTDAYALVADEFGEFAKRRPSVQVASHLAAHHNGIGTVVEMHKTAREVAVPAGEQVSQLALIEQPPRPGRQADFTQLQKLAL